MCLQCTETILKTTCIIHKQAQETPHHPTTANNTKTPYIRPETSKTAFPTVTNEPLRTKFEFRNSKMVVCTSNTPKLYSKQLVAYTSKHRKHHNTPNIVKNTNNVYTRPATSKTAFPTVTKELLGAKFEFRNSKMLVCASNAPKLYSKQLVSYTSKHRKHHNTPNTAKNTYVTVKQRDFLVVRDFDDVVVFSRAGYG